MIDRTWKLGIPHIVFTGGEPTLLPFLADLVEQVRGARAGHRPGDQRPEPAGPGLPEGAGGQGPGPCADNRPLAPEEVHDRLCGSAGAWKETIDGLKVALDEDLYTSTNTTIMRSNYQDMEDTMRFLISLGVKNIAFNGIIRSGKGTEAEGITYPELASPTDQTEAASPTRPESS